MQNAFDGLISRLHVAGKTSLLKDIKTEVSKLKSQDKKGLGWAGGTKQLSKNCRTTPKGVMCVLTGRPEGDECNRTNICSMTQTSNACQAPDHQFSKLGEHHAGEMPKRTPRKQHTTPRHRTVKLQKTVDKEKSLERRQREK